MSQPTSTVPARRRMFPNLPLAGFRQDMDSLLDNFFGVTGLSEFIPSAPPSVDVSETATSVEVKTDLPGYQSEEIHVDVGEGYLTIRGERQEEIKSDDPSRKFHRVERRQGAFSRTVALPCSVREDAVRAELKDGVLSIVLPKSDEAKRRKVDVVVG